MPLDDSVIPFRKCSGHLGELSNVIESTYDLLAILEYCVSDEMNYTPETKQKIQDLIDHFRSRQGGVEHFTYATNFP